MLVNSAGIYPGSATADTDEATFDAVFAVNIKAPVRQRPTGLSPRGAEIMMQGTPAGGSGSPDEVAHAGVYLASDEAAFVHGTVIDVDGGRVGVAVIAR